MTADFDSYFDYLLGRSGLAFRYRQFWLYPQLGRHLPGRTLDIGCGIGDLLRIRKGTVGVDINPRAVAHCREMGLDARLMEPDALPFDDNSFDSAVLDNVLEHIADSAPLLAEVRRVLVPSGTLIVGVPGQAGYAADLDHKVFYDNSGLEMLMSQNGFRTQKVLQMPLPFEPLSRLLRSYCLYGVSSSTKPSAVRDDG